MSTTVSVHPGSSGQDVSLMRWVVADRCNIAKDAVTFGAFLCVCSSVTSLFVTTVAEVWGLQLLFGVATVSIVFFGTLERRAFRHCDRWGGRFFASLKSGACLLADFMTRQLLIHELGHFLACLLLTGRVASVTISPFLFSGKIEGSLDYFNFIGACLGGRWAHIIIVASGPLGSLVTALLALICSHFQKDRNFNLWVILTNISRSSFYGEVLYALSDILLLKEFLLMKGLILSELLSLPQIAKWVQSKEVIIGTSHDFLLLAQYGYHPLACLTAMIIVFICVRAYLQKHYPRSSERTCRVEHNM